ncbi:MAG: family 16 glycosylhydrolase [Pseudomonadota bacterium]
MGTVWRWGGVILAAVLSATSINAAEPDAAGRFSDGFDTLDERFWHRAHYRFSHPDFDNDWDASLAQAGDGLVLSLLPQDGENRFVGASIRRQETTHFGRYEAVLTAAKGPGIITGFFLYTGPAYGTRHDEIDWEIFGKDTTTAQVAWWRDGELRSQKIDLGFDAAQGPNLYAIDWAPDRIRWYVNGALVFETREGVPEMPQRLFANVWAVDRSLASWAGEAPAGHSTRAKAYRLSHAPAPE